MAVPLTANEMETFTPPSLANLPSPPSFIVRTATQRSWIAFQDALASYPGLDRPLIFHSQEAMRAELIRGLDTLYIGEAVAAAKGRLQETWQILDMAEQSDDPEAAEKPSDEALAEMGKLAAEITNEWRPLTRMAADNLRWSRDAPRIAVGMFVAGWSGVDLPYEREAGVVTLTHVDKLAEMLATVERDAVKSNIVGIGTPGTAFRELSNEAFGRLNLTGEERKNSGSPSSSTSTPTDSPTASADETAAGPSTASATSKPTKTRRSSSPRKTG
jgi:hypothetical protein